MFTRKYPLRGYILGSGAPGTPGVILKTYGTTFISDILWFPGYSNFVNDYCRTAEAIALFVSYTLSNNRYIEIIQYPLVNLPLWPIIEALCQERESNKKERKLWLAKSHSQSESCSERPIKGQHHCETRHLIPIYLRDNICLLPHSTRTDGGFIVSFVSDNNSDNNSTSVWTSNT